MSGLSKLAEPMFVPDRALVEELIVLPLGEPEKMEFRAGVSSRARVMFDYSLLANGKEKSIDCDFYLEPGACIDVFHVLEGEMHGNVSAKIRYHLKKHA